MPEWNHFHARVLIDVHYRAGTANQQRIDEVKDIDIKIVWKEIIFNWGGRKVDFVDDKSHLCDQEN